MIAFNIIEQNIKYCVFIEIFFSRINLCQTHIGMNMI